MKQREHHLEDRRIVFDRLTKFDLKINPLKCALGVTSGKFLGFTMYHCGIDFDPHGYLCHTKLTEPKNLRNLCTLQGNLEFIWILISNMNKLCQPFNHLMKKDAPFH